MLPTAPVAGDSASTLPDLVAAYVVRGPSPDLSLGQVDAYGVYWDWSDLDGYFGSPDRDAALTPKGNADRATAATRFPFKERFVTVHGSCQVNNRDDLFNARDRLLAAWDRPNDYFDLVVEEPTPKRLRCRTSGPIEAPWSELTLSFEFTIPLVAPDPLKYGVELISATMSPGAPGTMGATFPWTFPLTFSSSGTGNGTLQMYNPGSADTFPTLSLMGPMSRGWIVENVTTGKRFSLDMQINAGTTVVVDMKTGHATVNGISVGATLTGTYWSLKANAFNEIRFTTPDSGDTSATATISAYPAYK